MEILLIEPFKQVGPFKLNVKRAENRKSYHKQPIEFYKTEDSKTPWDAYDDIGLHVEYNESDICEAIDLNKKSNPVYNNIEILKISYSKLLDELKQYDEDIEEDNTGFISYKLGLGIYAPEKDDFPNKPAEGVIIFKEDYYD